MKAAKFFSSAILMGILPVILAGNPHCPDDEEPPFTRLMLMTFDGVGAANGTNQEFARSYGQCRDVNANAEKAFQFFESFGIDMTIPRRDPFRHLSLDQYQFRAYFVDHPSSRALMGTFYEFGEYLNAPIHRSFWRMLLFTDVNGPRGLIKSGSFLYFGLLRIELNGRDFCIDYYTDEPVVGVNNGFNEYKVFPHVLYNDIWGFGASIGILKDEFAARRRRSYFWVLRFPGDGVY